MKIVPNKVQDYNYIAIIYNVLCYKNTVFIVISLPKL